MYVLLSWRHNSSLSVVSVDKGVISDFVLVFRNGIGHHPLWNVLSSRSVAQCFRSAGNSVHAYHQLAIHVTGQFYAFNINVDFFTNTV